MFNVLVTCYQVFKGISTAVSALVGKHVGAQTTAKIPLLLFTSLGNLKLRVAAIDDATGDGDRGWVTANLLNVDGSVLE